MHFLPKTSPQTSQPPHIYIYIYTHKLLKSLTVCMGYLGGFNIAPSLATVFFHLCSCYTETKPFSKGGSQEEKSKIHFFNGACQKKSRNQISHPFAKVRLPLLQGYLEQSSALKDFASSLHRFSFFKESMILSSTKLYLLDMCLVTSMINLGWTPFTLDPST